MNSRSDKDKFENQDLITKTEDFNFSINRYFIRWSVSIFLLGVVASFIHIPVSEFVFFQLLANITPAIQKWANASLYYDLSLLLWIYSTYSVLFIVLRLVLFTSNKKILEHPWKLFFLGGLMFLFSIFPFFDGSFFGIDISQNDSNPQSLFFMKTKTGIIFMTWMIGTMCIFIFSIYIMFFVELLKLRERFNFFRGNSE